MPWTPPAKPVNWQDTPSTGTPLDAADLNADESYAATVGQSVIDYATTTFDAAGAAAAAQVASLQKAANLADLASATAARTNLGLGALATQSSIGLATLAASQPFVVDLPENHGAKRDGRTITNAAMTAGSAVLTMPDTSQATFSAADVGKTFMVKAAGNVGVGNMLSTTVLSFQSATQVTLNATATNTVSGALAGWQTDDTAAIISAINSAVSAAQANGTNYCEVWFSTGIYGVGGALDHSQKGYAQIPPPLIAPASPKVALVLCGTSDQSGLLHWNQTLPQQSGAVLRTSLLAPAYSSTYGVPSVIGGPTFEQGYGFANNALFSNMLLVVDGITVILPVDHTQHGIDASCLAEANVPNMGCFAFGTVAANDFWPGKVPTAGFVYSSNWVACGLVMPSLGNNDNCNIGLYSAEGLIGGIALGEHSHATSIRVLSSNIGVTFTYASGGGAADHSMSIGYLSTESCRLHIYSPGGTFPLNILNWDIEDLNTLGTSRHLYDNAGGGLHGQINFTSQMITAGFNPFGGSGAHMIDVSRAHGHVASPTVPASTSAYANAFWRDAAVNVTGGTVSSIAVDGTTTGLTSGTVIVPSGKTITLTYTVAPAWNWTLL